MVRESDLTGCKYGSKYTVNKPLVIVPDHAPLTRFSIRTTSNMPMLDAVQVIMASFPWSTSSFLMSHVASAEPK